MISTPVLDQGKVLLSPAQMCHCVTGAPLTASLQRSQSRDKGGSSRQHLLHPSSFRFCVPAWTVSFTACLDLPCGYNLEGSFSKPPGPGPARRPSALAFPFPATGGHVTRATRCRRGRQGARGCCQGRAPGRDSAGMRVLVAAMLERRATGAGRGACVFLLRELTLNNFAFRLLFTNDLFPVLRVLGHFGNIRAILFCKWSGR